MRLSWNEIRARAARFADDWKRAHYEKGESQTFYNEFFEAFGVTRGELRPSKNRSSGSGVSAALSICSGKAFF